MAGGKAAEGMEMVVRGNQDVYPIFLRIGVALAISVAGFMTARRRSRSRRYSSSLPASRSRFRSSSGAKSQARGELALGLKEDLRMLKGDKPPAKIVNGTPTASRTTVVGLSPRNKSSGNHEGFLLSELNDLVMKEIRENGKDLEIITASSMPKESEVKDESAMEQEIANLRKLVWSLQEKERNLELQLLEYYGMQEQEAAMRELESQSKMNSAETKFYSFKIESLQADNQRLLASLSECSRAMNELEAAKVTIKFLKKKLRLDGEVAKEKIAFLQQKLRALQSEKPKEEKENEEIERKLQKLKELEDETAELKRINSRLAEENSNLARTLESVQASQRFALEGEEESDELKEAKILKECNDKLMTDIEQLKTDRCADVEELVYLKWVNACLRYELRNYQPPPGKTIARDLSKKVSPRSEERAKQLILEYANSGGDEKSISSPEFDSEYSPSPSSIAEPEDSPADISTRRQNKNKRKFLSKLKKLVLGKDSSSNKASTADRIPRNPTSTGNSGRRVSKSISSIDDLKRDSFSSLSSSLTEDLNSSNQSAGMDAQADEGCQSEDSWSQGFSSSSSNSQPQQRIDLEEARKEKDEHCKRQGKASDRYERVVSGEDNAGNLGGCDTPEKAELKKYAFALMNTQRGGASKVKRRSASFDRLCY